MANSSLATYSNITKNQSGKRSNKIIGITPHYMADNNAWTAKNCADYFATTGRSASSNYCVGKDGSIAVSVNEDCHPWTSANWTNDECHVTIEVSNLNNTTGEIGTAAYNALVKLCADICKRNGITLKYGTDPAKSTLTMHKDVTTGGATACPGAWLASKITSGQFAKDVAAQMSGATTTATTSTTTAGKTVVWNYDAVLGVGDIVSSCPLKIYEYKNTGNCIYDGCANVLGLGGLVPLEDLHEADGTLDGACDQVLSNDKALVWLEESEVVAIDTFTNCVQIVGAGSGAKYWVQACYLCRKEYK